MPSNWATAEEGTNEPGCGDGDAEDENGEKEETGTRVTPQTPTGKSRFGERVGVGVSACDGAVIAGPTPWTTKGEIRNGLWAKEEEEAGGLDASGGDKGIEDAEGEADGDLCILLFSLPLPLFLNLALASDPGANKEVSAVSGGSSDDDDDNDGSNIEET